MTRAAATYHEILGSEPETDEEIALALVWAIEQSTNIADRVAAALEVLRQVRNQ